MGYLEVEGDGAPEEPAGGGFGMVFSALGAVVSLGLIAGLGLWSVDLVRRDISGVPVVRALAGPLRVAPDDPGGERAAHQGLAVNAVAAGEAPEPAAQVILAPRPVDLSEVPASAAAALATGQDGGQDGVAVPAGDPAALAAAVGEALDAARAARAPATRGADGAGEPAATEAAAAASGGLTRSPRPQPRPAAIREARAVAFTPEVARVEVDPASIAPGTRLVQLGAFASEEIARSEWSRIAARFAEVMEGKRRVVQRAESGGKVFYRLRAMGFKGLADSRRFCAALGAGGADCIPVAFR